MKTWHVRLLRRPLRDTVELSNAVVSKLRFREYLRCCRGIYQSRSYITTDSQSASPPWCQALIWDPRQIFPIFSLIIFLDSFWFVDVGHPLWREVGSVLFGFCRASPAQPFSNLSPTGLTNIVYCLYSVVGKECMSPLSVYGLIGVWHRTSTDLQRSCRVNLCITLAPGTTWTPRPGIRRSKISYCNFG
jgi:hypothetical protein